MLSHKMGVLATWAAAATLAVAAVGCNQNGEPVIKLKPEPKAKPAPNVSQVVQMETTVDVSRVLTFYNATSPWIWAADKSQVRGIMVGMLFLIGPQGKGVFGNGILRPKVYVVPPREGREERKPVLVKEWAFDVDQAKGFRAKKEHAIGWGYGLPLTWGELDLGGRQIMMIVSFERADGLVVTSSPKYFRVPSSAM